MTDTQPARPLLAPCSPHVGGRPPKACSPLAPLPTGASTLGRPTTTTTPTPTSSPQGRPQPTPWFPTTWNGWHYPNPNHPAALQAPYTTQTRTNPCPLCGAPTGAQCVTRTGQLYDGNHIARSTR